MFWLLLNHFSSLQVEALNDNPRLENLGQFELKFLRFFTLIIFLMACLVFAYKWIAMKDSNQLRWIYPFSWILHGSLYVLAPSIIICRSKKLNEFAKHMFQQTFAVFTFMTSCCIILQDVWIMSKHCFCNKNEWMMKKNNQIFPNNIWWYFLGTICEELPQDICN